MPENQSESEDPLIAKVAPMDDSGKANGPVSFGGGGSEVMKMSGSLGKSKEK